MMNENSSSRLVSNVSLAKKRLNENGLNENFTNQMNGYTNSDDKVSYTSSESDNVKTSPKLKKKKTFNIFTKLRKKKSGLALVEMNN